MSWLLVQVILFYRITIGRFLGGHCRYYPSCSQYAIDAIGKYGPARGIWMALKRIGRCHPFSRGGVDHA